MKKILLLIIPIFVFSFTLLPSLSLAQGMPAPHFAVVNSAVMGNIAGTDNTALQNDDGHTAREEAEGKLAWEKLQAKQTTCADLSSEDFGALGEYFMGLMMGEQHEAMNNMMKNMVGDTGEEQMHIAMGKRMSGCDPNAPVPQNMMSRMMGGMMAGYPLEKGGDNNMMGNFGTYGYGTSFFGFFGMLI